MIDPTGQLYVVSKTKGRGGRLARLPASAWGTGARAALDMSQAAVLQVVTSHNDPQGGDISPDGSALALVYEEDVYYFSGVGVGGTDYAAAVTAAPPARMASYVRVKSSEAIAFTPTGGGLVVLAEGLHQTFRLYPRSDDKVVG